jgi:hypothetical protein
MQELEFQFTDESSKSAFASSEATNRAATSDIKKALAMIDLFATTLGARIFHLSILDIKAEEVPGKQRPRTPITELRQIIGDTMRHSEALQQSVVIRPDPVTATPIQLDDLDKERAEKLTPHAFMIVRTSAQKYQAWLAVTDAPKELYAARAFKRRVKRGVGGNDKNATGAVRIAGSLNFKTDYAPNFPMVEMTHIKPGRTVTVAELDQAKLLGEEEKVVQPPPVQPRTSSATYTPKPWPDYKDALDKAWLKSDSTPDRSAADHLFCMWCLQRKCGDIDQVAARLLDVSPKAQERRDRHKDPGYARVTAFNAWRKVEEQRLRGERPRSSGRHRHG